MQNNKKGFTLSEVLVCLMIAGIIMALSVNSIKIVRESYVSLAYYAFKNLQGMVTELFSGSSPSGSVLEITDENGNNISYLTRQCINSNGTIIRVLKSDTETNAWDTPLCSTRTAGNGSNVFCNALAQISNTSGAISCENLSKVDILDGEPYISELTEAPNFRTTNGQKFYVSEWVAPSDSSLRVSSEFGYRLVGIDLNASSNPNTNTGGASLPPDIVTFMVLDNGEVFPLGVAADNYTSGGNTYMYLNARLKGYYYNVSADRLLNDNNNVPADCQSGAVCNYAVVPVPIDESTVLSYRKAYCGAVDSSQSAYTNYCTGLSNNPYNLCPGGTATEGVQSFDLCRADVVKPAFRFSFD